MSRPLAITVDHDICVGNGRCVAIAPRVFVHNESRQSVVTDPGGAAEDIVLRAALDCPVGAIQVRDARTGERLFPR